MQQGKSFQSRRKRPNPYVAGPDLRAAIVPRGMPPAGMAANRQGAHRATEIKSMDIATFSIAGTTTGAFQTIATPVEGASFYNRIGRRIQGKSLHLNGYWNPIKTNPAASDTLWARVIVFYDRQANGANPSYADLITAYNSAGATSSAPLDGLNMNNRDRFLILMDEKCLLPPVGINGASAASTNFGAADPNQNAQHAGGRFLVNRFIKLRGLETHFKASAGAIGDVATGAISVFATSTDAATNANASYQFTSNWRFKFYD